MTKTDFKEYICRPYCMFFREGEKEEMACQGAIVVERLVTIGKIGAEELGHFNKGDALFKLVDQNLFTYVCDRCPFCDHDCDFQDENGPDSSEPCGGYILLLLLKRKRMLDEIDIMEAGLEC